MGDSEAVVWEWLEDYGGFLATYRSWYHEQGDDDRPSAEEVIETLTAEYHSRVERPFIQYQGEGW